MNRVCPASKQTGAVAIMTAIAMLVLIAVLGLVIDLGFLYTRKTELQNAADAAALAGAKELNGSAAGVNLAVQEAIILAGAHGVDFGSDQLVSRIDIGDAEIEFGPSPDGPWSSVAVSQGAPADKLFIKVDTSAILQGSRPTWFMRVVSAFAGGTQFENTRTFGLAVAGRYLVQVTPLGVCAIDVAPGTQPGSCSVPTVNSCNDENVKDCGFLRGVAYNIPDLNPLNNGDPIWINPVDAVGSGSCSSNNGSTPVLAPFVCTGQSAVITSLPGCVWVNTGTQAVMSNPLNSRFGDYAGGQHCNDPATAPPDTNVQEYICTRIAGGPNPDDCAIPPPPPFLGSPRDWMDPTNDTTPIRQSIETHNTHDELQGKPFYWVKPPGSSVPIVPIPARTSPEIAANFARYGVLWSYNRELNFSATPPTEYGTGNWSTLYGGEAQDYPATSPYLQFVTPPSGPGEANATANRRVLNIAIIDCSHVPPTAGQSCRQQLPVLAIGKFFMQRRADLPNRLYGEFAGLISTLPPAEIRLYH